MHAYTGFTVPAGLLSRVIIFLFRLYAFKSCQKWWEKKSLKSEKIKSLDADQVYVLVCCCCCCYRFSGYCRYYNEMESEQNKRRTQTNRLVWCKVDLIVSINLKICAPYEYRSRFRCCELNSI